MTGRGALDLISSYGDDDEDDYVPGPKVSTKRLHKCSDDEEEVKKVSKSCLPVPDIFKKNSEAVVAYDNPADHEGRLRSFPHERGNWATYVYIPYENNECIESLTEDIVEQFPELQLKVVSEFHLSLTKTVTLKYHWIDSFTESLRNNLKYLQRFVVMFEFFQVYCNEERTRTFVGLQVKTGHSSLLNITQILDKCLLEFNLETFYKNPNFHVSIFWCLGDKENEIKTLLPLMNDLLFKLLENSSQSNWYIYVSSLMCKIGNKFFNFPLK